MKRKTTLFSSVLVLLLALSVVPSFAAPPGPTIVEVAVAVNSEGPFSGAFDTLIAAVLAADPAVVETLTGNGQFTVFAPTDDAFAALGLNEYNVGDTTVISTEALTEVLLYHVARGRRDAADVTASDQIRMLNGEFLMVDGTVLTDNQGGQANIIVPDVPAANGIIHAIDAVVLP
jgi:uncharacterized surface protein with fasciclin (FAS1) repeats